MSRASSVGYFGSIFLTCCLSRSAVGQEAVVFVTAGLGLDLPGFRAIVAIQTIDLGRISKVGGAAVGDNWRSRSDVRTPAWVPVGEPPQFLAVRIGNAAREAVRGRRR